jgi:hypothetical protein
VPRFRVEQASSPDLLVGIATRRLLIICPIFKHRVSACRRITVDALVDPCSPMRPRGVQFFCRRGFEKASVSAVKTGSLLKPGEPVILTGPTGTPTETPSGRALLLVGTASHRVGGGFG